MNDQKISYEQLKKFIEEADGLFPVPLSDSVNLTDYTKKLFSKAYLCAEVVNDDIVSLVAGYTDNIVDNMSYITLVATLENARRKGFAAKLMSEFVEACRQKGIRGVHLHTNYENADAISFYSGFGFEKYEPVNEIRPDRYHLVYWI